MEEELRFFNLAGCVATQPTGNRGTIGVRILAELYPELGQSLKDRACLANDLEQSREQERIDFAKLIQLDELLANSIHLTFQPTAGTDPMPLS